METAAHPLVPNQRCTDVRRTPANLQQPSTIPLYAPELFHLLKFCLRTNVRDCTARCDMSGLSALTPRCHRLPPRSQVHRPLALLKRE